MAKYETLHRLFRNFLIFVLLLTALGAVLPALNPPGGLVPPVPGAAFSFVFFLGGILWLVVAYFSGGFVSTYLAPTRFREVVILPEESPEVMQDLRTKLDQEPIAMVVAFLKAVLLFGLCAVFWFVPVVGAIVLGATLAIFAYLFAISRPAKPGPHRAGSGAS
jgi:hypothetical protein